LCAKL
jgi:hypothetical protein